MKYTNPVIKGFYPDPSVCECNGKYFLVCSSFQYFPGVPLFESDDLVNWTQKSYVLTRKSQVMLEKINSSGGVFAPTIRCEKNRFYMVTTNDTTHKNFYVYTDDINSEWSEPINVEQDGIDPSLYFEDGRAYFMSNGTDEMGIGGVVQCEINIKTGEKLSPSKCIWQGSGGRFLESPHLYKIGEYYYLMAAEGGTEYGHMITCARSKNIWGEFVGNPHNPILTNRNKAPFIIQGIGHGDLVRDKNGEWHILSLGFRQQHIWLPYHQLGREVFLTPVKFNEDGWFSAGKDGTADEKYEINGCFEQHEKKLFTIENTDWKIDWSFIRHPDMSRYILGNASAVLKGTAVTLDDVNSPTFVALRQRDFCGEISCKVRLDAGEAGLSAYMCENEHYEIALRRTGIGTEAVEKLSIGGIKHISKIIPLETEETTITIRFDNLNYSFAVISGGKEFILGSAPSKYLSSEVSGGFTGVMLGIYAQGNNTAEFTDFRCEYK